MTPRALLLFEVFEVPDPKWTKNKTTKPRQQQQINGDQFEDVGGRGPINSSAQDMRVRRIAWGFYTPVTETGDVILRTLSPLEDGGDADAAATDDARLEREQQDCDSGTRLQLFEYQTMTWIDQYQARTQWPAASSRNSNMPGVFLQYQKQRRVKVPSTLYIDIRPIVPPLGAVSSERPATESTSAAQPKTSMGDAGSGGAGQQQRSSLLEGPDNVGSSSRPDAEASISTAPATSQEVSATQEQPISTLDPLIVCKRDSSETCLVPHRVLYRLSTGKRGCSCIAFSPCGLYLAAAVSSDADDVTVRVFRVNSSRLVCVCRGHRGMVYSLEWDPHSRQLLSTSSDGTARLWAMVGSIDGATTISSGRGRSLGIWQHTPAPCFVYCGIFLTLHVDAAITGASDGIVRFWSTTGAAAQQRGGIECGRLRVSKTGAVQCIRIESRSKRLFCGDSVGILTVWSASSAAAPSTATEHALLSYELLKTIDTGQTSVTSLSLHPRKQHLVVHTQPNGILQYELRSYLLLNKSYAGVVCESLLGRSEFSPDGRFVASGSENGVPLLFASVQGQRFQRGVWGSPFFHRSPVTDITWSPTAHIVALCSYGEARWISSCLALGGARIAN